MESNLQSVDDVLFDPKRGIKSLYLIPLAVALLALCWRIVRHQQYLNHDVAMFLQCGELLLANKLPYVDFVDVNPPLIFYMSIPAVLLGRLVGSLPFAVFALTMVLLVYSLVGSFMILNKNVKSDEWVFLAPVLFGFLIFNIAAFLHFGQREHLFVLMFLPYFFMRWLRQQGHGFGIILAISVGIIAGIGISIKLPHFLLIPFALEVYWILRNRTSLVRLKDIEVISIAGFIIAYGALFAFFEPSSVIHSFLFRWVPLTAFGFDAYFCSLPSLFFFIDIGGSLLPSVYCVIVVCLAALYFCKKNSLVGPLLVWVLSGWCVYLLQRRGWSYHTIPMVAAYLMLANLELALIARSVVTIPFKLIDSIRHSYPLAAQLLIVYFLLLIPLLPFLISDSFTTGKVLSQYFLSPIQKYSNQNSKVLGVVCWAHNICPALIQSHRQLASRYLWTYPLPCYHFLAIHAQCTKKRMEYEGEEHRVVDELCDDVEKEHPDLIAIWKLPPRWDATWTIYRSLDTNRFENLLNNYYPVEPANLLFSLWARKCATKFH